MISIEVIALLIETKRLVLRPVEMEDARFLSNLLNDQKLRNDLGAYSLIFPMSVENERNWIAQINNRENEAHMIIELKRDSSSAGILSFKDITQRNASAHLSIILERGKWNKGYGSEAIDGALKFVFERLNKHRIWLRVDEENAPAIRCYEKCGFTLEGVLREDHFMDGAWKNSLIMSILSEEYWRRRK